MVLDFALLPAFLIASLASTLKSVGDLTLCQKINDADRKRTDMQSVSGGIFAGAIGTGLSGLLGGSANPPSPATSVFPSPPGPRAGPSPFLAGSDDRLAFLPKLAAFFAVMPDR